MVSLWPFKGDDTSPASFEKALSTLSAKHKQTTTRLDALRQSARRFKALWTLYSVFIYLLYTTIDVLVLGWRNWGVWEYGAVVGGPFAIYIVRAVAHSIYEYRISRSQTYLDSLNKQRDETIEKLKVATRYNSTQELLEKYGGERVLPSNKSKTADSKNNKRNKNGSKAGQQQQGQQNKANLAVASGRTGLAPPPTANIRHRTTAQDKFQPPVSPPTNGEYLQGKPLPPPPFTSQQEYEGFRREHEQQQAHFAPNAFPPESQSQYDRATAGMGSGPKWYDRFLDVLLGEDETSPKNRIVLICQNCRLVNGQAPPGVKTVEEMGRWRCGACGAWNGEESEAKKVLDSIQQVQQESLTVLAAKEDEKPSAHGSKSGESENEESDEDGENEGRDDIKYGKSDDEEQTKVSVDGEDLHHKPSNSDSGVSTRTRSKRGKK